MRICLLRARLAVGSLSSFQVGLHAALSGCELNLEMVSVGGAEAFLKPLLRGTLRQASLG
tara:strand:- start:52757 stop:52936 length:180 start_codon:yes stop_codon:yes gene_type:complete